MLKKTNVLGVGITNETAESILEYILQRLKTNSKFYIVTPNPEILVYATKHPEYKKILQEAEIAIPDGTGLFLASIFMAKPFKERIPGVDFMEEICKGTARRPISMGFLGAGAGIAERTAECLKKKYPHLNIVFADSEWPTRGHVSHIDILFVAYGAPKQEEWIYENLDKLPVKAAMGVGGAFDYISGHVTRAPFFIIMIGFEWLYRLTKEPWRFKRQLALIEFVKLVVKERFGMTS